MQVKLLTGECVRYVNLDNTATTPAFVEVARTVSDALDFYGSVHRGSGYKSLFSTWLFEHARKRVAEFVGADPTYHQVIFTSNTTGAINKAARVLELAKKDIVLVSQIEHSSNDLPWRRWATLARYGVLPDTSIDLNSIRSQLEMHGTRVKLVAVTGASNVTGYIPPLHDIAELAHSFDVPVFVDCAQLAPHRRIRMGQASESRRLDYIAFSAHKLGAPFGTGVLVGPAQVFAPCSIPSDEPGGGTTDILTEQTPYWTTSPDRFESGTPNAIGVLALAKALQLLSNCGMDRVEQYESALWEQAMRGLRKIKGVTLYVDPLNIRDHTPTVPFNIEGMSHGLVAAILGFEYGIGVRHGRHCADRLVMHLLGLNSKQQGEAVREVVERGNKTDIYGVVRPSIGVSNTHEDICRLIAAVERITIDGPQFEYEPEYGDTIVSGRETQQTGEYHPKGINVESLVASGSPPSTLLSISHPLNSNARICDE